MANEAETIGTARIVLEADTSSMQVSINRAQALVQQLGSDFATRFNAMDTAQKKATLSALNLATNVGKTRDEIAALTLQARGAAPEALNLLNQRLQAVSTSSAAAGMSAKQMAASMRLVPAQITDIVTGLATGQAPLTVLLQQGSQLKDMFGGVVPAAKALGTALLDLVTPWTAVAAAVGAFVIAINEGNNIEAKFNQAILSTNDYAGKTVSQLGELAQKMSNVSGSYSNAADVVQSLASSGKVAQSQFDTVAQGVQDFAKVTGESIKSAVADFIKLGDDPVKAATELNEQYHFLTASVQEQIEAAQKAGDTDKASSLAQDALASSFAKRREQMVGDIGLMKSAWDQLKDSASATWDAMMGVGKKETIADQINKIDQEIAQYKNGVTATLAVGPTGALVGTTTTQTSASDNQSKIKALELQKWWLQSQQAAEEYAASAHGALQQQLQDGISAKAALENLAKGYDTAAERAQAVKKVNQELEAQYKAFGTLPSGVTRSSSGSYGGKGYDYLVTQAQKQIGGASSVKQHDDTIDLVSANKELSDSITKDIDGYKKQLDQWSKGVTWSNNLDQAMQNLIDAQNEQIQNQVDSVSEGTKEYQRSQQLALIDKERAKALLDLQKQQASTNMSQEQYAANQAKINSDFDKLKNNLIDGYAKIDKAQLSWTNGALQGWMNFRDSALDVAGQVSSGISDAFNTLNDDLVTALNTGKTSFDNFATGILEDIEKIALKLAEEKLVSTLLSSFIPSIGGLTSGGDTFVDQGIASDIASFKSAKGNVFQGGDISKYSGSIVTSPTFFSSNHLTAFAKGGNVMGEAGPEAIMPLTRTSDGKLGVRSSGSSGVVVNVTTNVDASGSSSTQVSSSDQSDAWTSVSKNVAALARQEISKAMQPGGIIYNRMNGR